MRKCDCICVLALLPPLRRRDQPPRGNVVGRHATLGRQRPSRQTSHLLIIPILPPQPQQARSLVLCALVTHHASASLAWPFYQCSCLVWALKREPRDGFEIPESFGHGLMQSRTVCRAECNESRCHDGVWLVGIR